MSFTPRGLTPLIMVFDMTLAARFYREVLGFEVVSSSPEVDTQEGRFSHWMWLKRGGAELMLNTQFDSNERPVERDTARSAAHGDTVLYITCDDIGEVHRELTERGLAAQPPQQASYGLTQFSCKDPDGYLIVFQESPRQ
jgi:glyoxylase I family protein